MTGRRSSVGRRRQNKCILGEITKDNSSSKQKALELAEQMLESDHRIARPEGQRGLMRTL
jgi:hypothetical protein